MFARNVFETKSTGGSGNFKNKTKEDAFSYVDMVCSAMLWGLNKNASTHRRVPHI